MQANTEIEGDMTHGDEVPANIGDSSYIIPARLVKQLVAAMEPAPQPSARELLLKFLDAAKIEYRWEEHSCGDGNVSQVWFGCKEGWELVFEFNAETGTYEDIYLEG